jgi:hypothetical protein
MASAAGFVPGDRERRLSLDGRDSLASRLNRVAEREKGAGRTKAGLFFELPYSCHFRCFVVAIFSLRDGPAVAILFAPEWAARWTRRTLGSRP